MSHGDFKFSSYERDLLAKEFKKKRKELARKYKKKCKGKTNLIYTDSI